MTQQSAVAPVIGANLFAQLGVWSATEVAPKWLGIAAIGVLLAAPAGANAADTGAPLSTDRDKMSYGVGVDVARNFKRSEVDIDINRFIQGYKDALSGEKLLLNEKELHAIRNTLMTQVRQQSARHHEQAAEQNRTKGAAFLAANNAKPGIVALPSGLQYKILTAGTGMKPTDTDAVEVHYRGTLLDGTEFDATDPGKTATLQMAQVISGWREALKLMPAGSKWQLFIPGELAYGSRGVGQDIGPNETLIFEVELLAVTPRNAAAPVAPGIGKPPAGP